MYGWTKQIAVHEMSMINTPDEQMNDLRATTHTLRTTKCVLSRWSNLINNRSFKLNSMANRAKKWGIESWDSKHMR